MLVLKHASIAAAAIAFEAVKVQSRLLRHAPQTHTQLSHAH